MTNTKRLLAATALVGAALAFAAPAHAAGPTPPTPPTTPKLPIAIYDGGLVNSLTDGLGLTQSNPGMNQGRPGANPGTDQGGSGTDQGGSGTTRPSPMAG